jgi:hypothetical protein
MKAMNVTDDGNDRVNSKLTAELTNVLRELPVGSHFHVHPSAPICYCLEVFLPRRLRERYPEWEKESLDGIFVARAIKTGARRAEFVGTCILITDQTLTPFVVELEVAEPNGPVTVQRLRLGEPGSGPLGISGPEANSKEAERLLASIVGRVDDIAWSYVLETP